MATQRRLSRADFPSGPPQKRASNDFLSISIWRKKEGSEPKFACVVSKKTAHLAVERNKLKRRFREIASLYLSSTKDPLSLVVYPKKNAQKVSFEELRVAFESLMKAILR